MQSRNRLRYSSRCKMQFPRSFLQPVSCSFLFDRASLAPNGADQSATTMSESLGPRDYPKLRNQLSWRSLVDRVTIRILSQLRDGRSAVPTRMLALPLAPHWAPCSLALPSLAGCSSGLPGTRVGRRRSKVRACRSSSQSSKRSACNRCRLFAVLEEQELQNRKKVGNHQGVANKCKCMSSQLATAPRTAYSSQSHLKELRAVNCLYLREMRAASVPMERPLQLKYSDAQVES